MCLERKVKALLWVERAEKDPKKKSTYNIGQTMNGFDNLIGVQGKKRWPLPV